MAERFERSGQRADLDEAVTVLRAAEAMVEVTERSSLCLNLANALARRHARFADLTDLDTAVDSARQAVAHPETGSVRLLRYRTTPAHLQTMQAPVLPRWRPVRKADGRGVPRCPSGLIT
jgi:acyl-CoA reductase-like NAD-dependent aldehyde dehydrogenase